MPHKVDNHVRYVCYDVRVQAVCLEKGSRYRHNWSS